LAETGRPDFLALFRLAILLRKSLAPLRLFAFIKFHEFDLTLPTRKKITDLPFNGQKIEIWPKIAFKNQ
jgi:hypothetical protein